MLFHSITADGLGAPDRGHHLDVGLEASPVAEGQPEVSQVLFAQHTQAEHVNTLLSELRGVLAQPGTP